MLRRPLSPEFDALPDQVSTVTSRVSSLVSVSPGTAGERPDRRPENPGSAPADERALPDTERVHRILERNNGRVYQAGVVEATGWSKAKVSRVLDEMEGTEEVDRFWVGRQKVVCYPQYLPEWTENDR